MDKKFVKGGFGVVVVNDKGEILLGKRHDDPEKASSELRGEGTWTMPGGKMDFGESFEEGARREVEEETSLVLKDVKVIAVNNEKNEHAHFVTVGLFSDSFEGSPKVMEPDEITEWRWFKPDEFPEKIYPPTKSLLRNYLEKKFYVE